ncbi:MAG: hypothetical protein GXY24_05380 [Bacteroidales bacterium]|nr:hypothetical protein [Bacteroidales bacterium]
MKKVLFTLLLALAALPSAWAQFAQIEGDPVDYNLIYIPRDSLSVPLDFVMENPNFHGVDILNYALGPENGGAPIDTSVVGFRHIDFKGELRHTKNISSELIETAVQLALAKTHLTRRELAILSDQIDRYAEINYNVENFKDDMAKFVAASLNLAGVPGEVGDAIKLARESMVTGNFSYNTGGATLDLAQEKFDRVIDNMLDNPTSDPDFISTSTETMGFLSSIPKVIGTIEDLQTIGGITLDAYARDIQKWDNRVAASAFWRYMSFYNWANYYLCRLARQQGDDAWVLMITERSQPIPIEFSGTHNSVTWTLSAFVVKCADLPPLPQRLPYDHEGYYVGIINAHADYDLSGFEKGFVGTEVKKVIIDDTENLWKILTKEDATPGLASRNAAMQLANTAPMMGGGLDNASASISLSMDFHTPVYLELLEDGRTFDGVATFDFTHLAEMDNASFDKIAIAQALGIAEADPKNTTKIHMSMDCRAEGIEEHYPGKPAVPLMVQETVDGDKYFFTMRHGNTLRRESASTFEFVGGYFPTIMPYGEIHIHVGEMLEPTSVPSQPNDKADRVKILSKYFK